MDEMEDIEAELPEETEPEPEPKLKFSVSSRRSIIIVTVEEQLNKLRDWLQTIPYLPQDLSDDFLKTFLNLKETLEMTKQSLLTYYRLRRDMTTVFRNRHPVCRDNDRYSSVSIVMLTKPTTENWVIIWASLNDSNVVKYHPFQICKLVFVELDILLRENCLQGKTIAAIWDMKNFTSNHFAKLSKYSCFMMNRLFSEGFPQAIGPIYIINAPHFVSHYTFCLPTMDFRIVDNIDHLQGFLPKEFLPIELGGEPGSKSHKDCSEEFSERLWSYGPMLAHEELQRDIEQMIRLCLDDVQPEQPKTKNKRSKKKKKSNK